MIAVTIPLINPNEPEALLAALHVHEGEQVRQGAPLCTLETTKSTAEVVADHDGYVTGLRLSAGEQVRAGAVLCYLADSPDETPPAAEQAAGGGGDTAGQPGDLPEGLRITQPALALARQAGLTLDRLPQGPLVTEKQVRQLLEQASQPEFAAPQAPFDPNTVVLYGGGGHARIVIDLLSALRLYSILGIIDDGRPAGELVMGVPVLGGAESLAELHARGIRLAVNCVGGIGNPAVRVQVFERLAAAGFACPAIIHPTAIVEPGARVAPGAHILARAYLGSEVRVGYGCIVSTAAVVSHDCVLHDYANISPGAVLAGEVIVGAGALVGMGATINLRVKIGQAARIGNSATVKSDLPDHGIVQAGAVWPV